MDCCYRGLEDPIHEALVAVGDVFTRWRRVEDLWHAVGGQLCEFSTKNVGVSKLRPLRDLADVAGRVELAASASRPEVARELTQARSRLYALRDLAYRPTADALADLWTHRELARQLYRTLTQAHHERVVVVRDDSGLAHIVSHIHPGNEAELWRDQTYCGMPVQSFCTAPSKDWTLHVEAAGIARYRCTLCASHDARSLR